MKVLVTTVPFGSIDSTPIKEMERHGIEYVINPLGRKLTEDELSDLIEPFDALIAGTEQIGYHALKRAKNLKLISRVGIGLDSVDLIEARRRGIKVAYTPEAPAPAVAELTIGLMISLLRQIQISNMEMHKGEWYRYFGRRLEHCTIGIIGAGRIGSRVINYLQAFNPKKILFSDRDGGKNFSELNRVYRAEVNEIFESADIVSLHLPLTVETRNLIGASDMRNMKPEALLLNTSRGGIINEADLYTILQDGHLGGAAIDVFDKEPYEGLLAEIDRCILTAHMGSMSVDCRVRMEIEATEEVIRYHSDRPLKSEVPEEEYEVQRIGII